MVGGAVAAQGATVHSAYLAETGAALREYEPPADLMGAVLGGGADSALADLASARESVAASGGALAIVGLRVMLGLGIGTRVREDDAALRARFGSALASMGEDGSLNRLIREWFGEEAELF